jgi:diaminopimelate epimerase
VARSIPFLKMHGLENDYLFLNGLSAPLPEPTAWPELARRMSDRHAGVGADGIILLLPSSVADLRMRILNADGSEAEMCGNGLRCAAKWAAERGVGRWDRVTVETGAGVLTTWPRWRDGRVVSVREGMGRPDLRRGRVGDVPGDPSAPFLDGPVPLQDGREATLCLVSMGNPHAVWFVAEDSPVTAGRDGPALETHPYFPRRVNVTVARLTGEGRIQAATWERGSGLTRACGTGAAATMAAARATGRVGDRATLSLPGGDLEAEWDGEGEVFLTGPAVEVCAGSFALR